VKDAHPERELVNTGILWRGLESPGTRKSRGLSRGPLHVDRPRQTPAATGAGFSIGTPTMLPHSVQLPS
jgi:hypothetical protein